MAPYCAEENIAMTPYSALASGRLSRLPGEGDTKRAAEDSYAKAIARTGDVHWYSVTAEVSRPAVLAGLPAEPGLYPWYERTIGLRCALRRRKEEIESCPGPVPAPLAPEEYAARTIPGPPVARMQSLSRMTRLVISRDGSSIQPMISSGAPARTAAS